MSPSYASFNAIDKIITSTLATYGIQFLRVSLGIIFFWFGFLKFFPGMSPATALAAKTIEQLTFGFVDASLSVPILAAWETFIGICLIYAVFLRVTIFLLFLQLIGTFSPLVLFPSETFQTMPFSPTLEGQYIIKNLVLLSSAMVIGATVRGGKLVPEPRARNSRERAELATLKT